MGPVKYMTEMPAVFRYSKLNLCPTIRSIVSGIPLRALDIMGSGGVLFANYQIELAENFIDGQDLILYSSLEEAYDKASFYLDNPDLIKSIAESGFEKVKEAFNYKDKLDILLDIKK
jgi:spore maturation protein CgeB